jgi:hypothetical protein
MGQHHYCFASKFLGTFPTYDPVDLGLNKAAAGFASNLFRIQSLGRLPILLLGAGLALQHFDSRAALSLGLMSDDPRLHKEHPHFDPTLYERKEAIRKDIHYKWFVLQKNGEVPSGIEMGENVLSILASQGEPETAEGIDSILKGMITGMWTAFEVLVEMIWNAVDEARPNLKAQITKPEWADAGLRSLPKAQNLYRVTFKVDHQSILDSLENEKALALALTRNIIVHTNDMIDERFDKQRSKLKTGALSCFANVKINQKIELTGEIVRDLITPIPSLGFDLIREVDQWLIAHP